MDFRTGESSDQPLVSLGVISYNYDAYVIQTLDSIFNQTYHHIELFIVDDFSTDNSATLIRNWIKDKGVQCTFIEHPENLGRNRGINTFHKLATGKYITTFATDDVMNPRRIEEQVKTLEAASEEYAVCYSDAELINEEGEYRGLYSEKYKSAFLEGDVFPEFYHGRFFMAAPTIFFRRKVFETVGGYDERLWAEDYDMWMRLLPFHKVKFCPYVTVKYRIKDVSYPDADYREKLNHWYHRDRIFIYHRLITSLKNAGKYADIEQAVRKKINFHLLNLKEIKSPYFFKMFKFLMNNSFYKLSYKHLLKMHIKQSLQFNKAKETF